MFGLFILSLIWLVVGLVLHSFHHGLPIVLTWLPATVIVGVWTLISIFALTALSLASKTVGNATLAPATPIRHGRR
jgi:hypothetical protein